MPIRLSCICCAFALLVLRAAAIDSIALQEMSNLAQAEQFCLIDTNFYVSLENLDDLPVNTSPTYNFINAGGGTWVIGQTTANFLPNQRNLLTAFLKWQGPYITYQAGRADDADFFNYDIGTPLDPWGSPYFFYSPLGRIDPPNSITAADYADTFDRFAIVSYGADGMYQGGDDLFIEFGGAPANPTLSANPNKFFSVGDTATFRGYNFGAQGGSIQLTFNGAAVTDGILSWSSTQIQKLILPADPQGAIIVGLTNNGNPAGLQLQIIIEDSFAAPPLNLPASALHWTLYQ